MKIYETSIRRRRRGERAVSSMYNQAANQAAGKKNCKECAQLK